MTSRPNAWVPCSKAVAGGLVASVMSPSIVREPVRSTATVAVPLITDVPMNTLCAAWGSSAPFPSPALFSTGYGSPVRRAWLTKKSRLSSTRPSAGTRSPAQSMTTSPGTTSLTGTSHGFPSRITEARTATEAESRSAACPARCSCTKSSVTLMSTMTVMMTKLVRSPVSAEIALAARRRSTRRLRKRDRNSSAGRRRRRGVGTFAPKRARRAAASALLSPVPGVSPAAAVWLMRRRAAAEVLDAVRGTLSPRRRSRARCARHTPPSSR
jgi:hypothetical protein